MVQCCLREVVTSAIHINEEEKPRRKVEIIYSLEHKSRLSGVPENCQK